MMSVRHKASVTEGGEDGATWWTRACSTDREAIVLLKPEDAETLLQDKGSYRRPPKPRPTLVLLYRDGRGPAARVHHGHGRSREGC